MTLSLGTAYRSFGGEVEASSTPTICRLPDSRRHQLWAIAPLENIKLYVVTYDQPGTTLRTPTALDLATKKRLMFEYEREVRAIATVDTPNPKLGKGEFG